MNEYYLKIPVDSYEDAVQIAEEYYGAMMWMDGKSYPHDIDHPCIIMPIDQQEKENESKCECHERDSSYVCAYCYSQGLRGHMQE